MSITRLRAIAYGKSPLPNERVNVRSDADQTPLMRRLIHVSVERRNGEEWLYWYWTPEQTGDVRVDCGYSGHRLSEAR